MSSSRAPTPPEEADDARPGISRSAPPSRLFSLVRRLWVRHRRRGAGRARGAQDGRGDPALRGWAWKTAAAPGRGHTAGCRRGRHCEKRGARLWRVRDTFAGRGSRSSAFSAGGFNAVRGERVWGARENVSASLFRPCPPAPHLLRGWSQVGTGDVARPSSHTQGPESGRACAMHTRLQRQRRAKDVNCLLNNVSYVTC